MTFTHYCVSTFLNIISSFCSFTSDDENSGPNTPGTSMKCYASTKEFSAYVRRFPVLLDGQPQRKKQGVNEGFLKDRVFYDRWRNSQYAKREEYLLCKLPNSWMKHWHSIHNSNQAINLVWRATHMRNVSFSLSAHFTRRKGGEADCTGGVEGQLSKAWRDRAVVETSNQDHHWDWWNPLAECLSADLERPCP